MKVHLPGFENLLPNHIGCGGGREVVKGKVSVAVVAHVVVVAVGSSVADEKQKKTEPIDLFWVVV